MVSAGTRLFLSVLAAAVLRCDARVTDGIVPLGGAGGDAWRYFTKFGFDVGTSEYKFRMRLQEPSASAMKQDADVSLQLFLDEDWPETLSENEVCARSFKARTTSSVPLSADGSFSDWMDGTIDQHVRPHIWFFALSDCDGTLANGTHRIEWEMEMLQDGGSHFSVEMRGMSTANVLNLALFTGFLIVFYRHSQKFVNSAGYLHPVIWFLSAAMLLQYVAHWFHTAHLLQYGRDGVGITALDTVAQIFLMLAQVCQTSLLILIGLGYTLLRSKLGESDVAIPLCFVVAVAHVVLVAIGKFQDDAHYKYHENEGIVGWILLTMRLALFVWFIFACRGTTMVGGNNLRHFMANFATVGSLYFLAYPTIFVVFKLFAPYLQHGLMTVGLMAMQMTSNVWLSSLFLTRGEYFKVSTLSDSCLPGGLKVGLAKLD